MPKKSVSFRDWQLEKLADPNHAAKYLTVSMQDSPEMFLAALVRVAQANRLAKIAEESGVSVRVSTGQGCKNEQGI